MSLVPIGSVPAGCVSACPACPHRNLPARESLVRKESWVREELEEWRDKVLPVVSLGPRWAYRRKAQLHARLLGDGWRFGVVKFRGREEEFIPIPDCPLHGSDVNRRFALAAALVPPEWPLAYGLASGEAFTLVLKCRRREDFLKVMRSWSWPGLLFVSWNPVAGKRAVESRAVELVAGSGVELGCWKGVLEAGGLVHGPTSFRQQIPEMEELALGRASEFLAGAGVQRVVDLYSGLGASLRRWRDLGWHAAGVELSGESLECAALNAPGAVLLRGRVEDRLPQLTSFIEGERFVAYTNPPRSGHGGAVLEWFLRKGPERIAYLSCHPRSLAGDLRVLADGYSVEEIQPLDFFPQTAQVECLALLRRR